MGSRTKIEWCDATWNPVRGCTRVSQGCENCYAERIAARFSAEGLPYHGLAEMTQLGPRWTGKVELVREELDRPLHWRKPRRILVCSMGDLFHEGVTSQHIERVIETFDRAPQHTYLVLTKRPKRMLEVYRHCLWPPNAWVGVSVEDQKTATERLWALAEMSIPRVRFVSYEPALGPLNLASIVVNKSWAGGEAAGGQDYSTILSYVDWVIAGGETGPGARPAHPEWFRRVRDACKSIGVPFFFKQWGEFTPYLSVAQRNGGCRTRLRVPLSGWKYGGHGRDEDGTVTMYRIGRIAAGRLLDGQEWNELPQGGNL